jgi:2-dehydropantoate 2-reductase
MIKAGVPFRAHFMRLAIYGAGSLGTIIGAYITRSGTAIDLINRNVAHVQALRERGATVQGVMAFNTPVSALLPEEMTGVYDIISLLTKQQQNREVIEFLLPFVAEGGVVCTLQNGLPEPALAEVAGSHRILGGTVEWNAARTAPGVCFVASPVDTWRFRIGGLEGRNEEKLVQTKEVLQLMCPTQIEANFIGARWIKLLVNCAFGATSAVLGLPFRYVVDDPKARMIVLLVMKEAFDTATAAGITVEPFQGKNFVALFDFSGLLRNGSPTSSSGSPSGRTRPERPAFCRTSRPEGRPRSIRSME